MESDSKFVAPTAVVRSKAASVTSRFDVSGAIKIQSSIESEISKYGINLIFFVRPVALKFLASYFLADKIGSPSCCDAASVASRFDLSGCK